MHTHTQGLLEKHKDYVLRARDFQRKQATLKQLRSKAAMRNPDEFYFAMQKSRTKGALLAALLRCCVAVRCRGAWLDLRGCLKEQAQSIHDYLRAPPDSAPTQRPTFPFPPPQHHPQHSRRAPGGAR